MPRRRVPRVAHAVCPAGGLSRHTRAEGLGSEWLAAWTNQTLVSEEAYAPFGEAYAGAGAGEQMFTGKGQRLAAGIYDFPFRHYCPAQGRWTSPDPSGLAAVNPANPQSWNAYAYVANQPLTATDPLGLDCNPDLNKEWGQAIPGTGPCIVGPPQTVTVTASVGPGPIISLVPSAGFGGGVTAGGVGRVGMQTERLPPELIELAPAQSQGCAQPNFVRKVGSAAQAWLARLTGHDIGAGAGGSGGIGHIFGVAGDVSRQMIVSPNGQAAIVTTFAATPPPLGLVEGAGVFGGLQFSIGSPTSSPAELASPAVVGSFGGGDGLGAGLDVAAGPSGWEGTLTLGGGAGLEGNGGAALIAPAPVVTPVCAQ